MLCPITYTNMIHCLPLECLEQCSEDDIVVEALEQEEYCSITMPDNPYRRGNINDGDIIPCQIEIQSNCFNYCHVELVFNKFDLSPCGYTQIYVIFSTVRLDLMFGLLIL